MHKKNMLIVNIYERCKSVCTFQNKKMNGISFVENQVDQN